MFWILLLICSVSQDIVQGSRKVPGFGETLQDWGRERTNRGAWMFWWLYFVDPPRRPKNFDVYSRPLILWLDGGPGDGAAGFGNFRQIGPLDIDGVTTRKTTWVKDHNVLFIDAPAGSGFSYVTRASQYASDDNEVAFDILSCFMEVLSKHKNFRTVPLYIFGHSYGGKLAVLLAEQLVKRAKLLPNNLKGVGLSNPFISPVDVALSLGSFYNHLGYLDAFQKAVIDDLARSVQTYVEEENWDLALMTIMTTYGKIGNYTSLMDLENITLKPSRGAEVRNDLIELNKLMNNQVKQVLGVNSIFGGQRADVFDRLRLSALKTVLPTVKKLVTETKLKVVVFAGQMDGVIPIKSTEKWVNRVFKDDQGWTSAPRTPFLIDGSVEGYEKHYKRFSMYWILSAGHLVARDHPEAARAILKRLTAS